MYNKPVKVDSSILASRLKLCREARGINKATMARDLNITASSMTYYESGLAVPSVDKLYAIADYLYTSRFSSKAKVPKPLRFQDFLELLGRFELPTSSLPTAVEPSSPCCTRLFGGFCPKRTRSQPVCSIVSIRSFPRVGHSVGQATFRTRTRGAPPTAASRASALCPAHR